MFIAPLAGRSPRARSFRDRQRSWRADKDGSIALSQTSSGLSGCANAHAAIIGSRPLSWAAILSRSLLLFVNIASRSTPKSEPSRQRSKAFRTLSKTLKGQCESLTHIRVLSSPGSWRRRERAPPMKQRANKAPEPTPLPVTSRAYARLAPGSGVAHLWRSAKYEVDLSQHRGVRCDHVSYRGVLWRSWSAGARPTDLRNRLCGELRAFLRDSVGTKEEKSWGEACAELVIVSLAMKLALNGRTRRYSQHVCLSRSVLTHGPRQAHVWLIFDVSQNRTWNPTGKSFAKWCRGCVSDFSQSAMRISPACWRTAKRARRSVFGTPKKRRERWHARCEIVWTGTRDRRWRISFMRCAPRGCSGRKISRISARSCRCRYSMSASRKRANQALQPTRMLSTSAAEPPRVPSTRVADL
jgi:hypothetical protein